MNKLKLLIVSPFPPSKGTLNEYAFHWVNNMKSKKEVEEIIVLSDHLPDGQSYENITKDQKINIIPCWSFNSIFVLFNVLVQIIKAKPDMVFFNIHFLSFGDKKIAAALGLMMPMISRWIGYPSTVLLHNITETVDLGSAGITNNKILQKVYNFLGTLLTKIILQANFVTLTISKYVEILEEKYRATNVGLIPHGSFEVPPIPSYNNSNTKTVMTFGKFGTYKKVENLIEAVELVRTKTNHHINLVIAGTDSPNVKGYLNEVKRNYGYVKDVVYTGYVEEEDVPSIFNSSNVVVFPYNSTTGSSGVLHQAGSYGRATILPNIGDLKALIEEEGYTGEFFEPGDTNDLANAILRLIEDDTYCRQLGQKNYVAAASLPLEDITDWYLFHFESIVNKNILGHKESTKKLSAQKINLLPGLMSLRA